MESPNRKIKDPANVGKGKAAGVSIKPASLLKPMFGGGGGGQYYFVISDNNIHPSSFGNRWPRLTLKFKLGYITQVIVYR
jgi:hypothetical protein